MADLNSVIGDAVARQDAPFLVAMTGNAAGVTWSGAAGESDHRPRTRGMGEGIWCLDRTKPTPPSPQSPNTSATKAAYLGR